MSMKKEFSPERARKLTVQCVDQTYMTLKVNRELCVQLLRSMGAPTDAHAEQFLKMTMDLLNAVANHVQGGEVADGMERLKVDNAKP